MSFLIRPWWYFLASAAGDPYRVAYAPPREPYAIPCAPIPLWDTPSTNQLPPISFLVGLSVLLYSNTNTPWIWYHQLTMLSVVQLGKGSCCSRFSYVAGRLPILRARCRGPGGSVLNLTSKVATRVPQAGGVVSIDVPYCNWIPQL